MENAGKTAASAIAGPLTGEHFIGRARVRTGRHFSAFNPAIGKALDPEFSAAGPGEVDRACALAAEAFPVFGTSDRERRAAFLEGVAKNILACGDTLIERANAETGLPVARLTGERGRTVNQLNLFAREVRDGGWLGVRIDPALPDRAPLPRPDLRLYKAPLGPVAVFGASNFPLAFSVAGGDTAAAFAAGCPVIVKGHPAHPGTSELVANAIADAVAAAGLPEGVFSLLQGDSHELGQTLVSDSRIKAVGFTGSRAGGQALMKIAAARPEPIPVYAEMSSINPVVLLPHKLERDADRLGKDFIASLTLGAGQFCTNPGLVLAFDDPSLDRFGSAARTALEAVTPAVMLTRDIHHAYDEGVQKLTAKTHVAMLACGKPPETANSCQGAIFTATAEDFLADQEAGGEIFGAAALLVRCPDEAALLRVIDALEGQLTASLHFDDADEALASRLLPRLAAKAGRLIANGWPTGVEVSHAMVHGGPYPATSDGRSTSVGTLAIERFLRPICYQDIPEALLPPALQPGRQKGMLHRLDGQWRVE